MRNLRHNSSSSLYGYVLMIFLSLLFVSPVFAVDF